VNGKEQSYDIEALTILGLLQQDPDAWLKGEANNSDPDGLSESDDWIDEKVNARNKARNIKNFEEADRIRDELLNHGIILEDRVGGKTDWRRA